MLLMDWPGLEFSNLVPRAATARSWAWPSCTWRRWSTTPGTGDSTRIVWRNSPVWQTVSVPMWSSTATFLSSFSGLINLGPYQAGEYLYLSQLQHTFHSLNVLGMLEPVNCSLLIYVELMNICFFCQAFCNIILLVEQNFILIYNLDEKAAGCEYICIHRVWIQIWCLMLVYIFINLWTNNNFNK